LIRRQGFNTGAALPVRYGIALQIAGIFLSGVNRLTPNCRHARTLLSG
jgi:hypothetical protein